MEDTTHIGIVFTLNIGTLNYIEIADDLFYLSIMLHWIREHYDFYIENYTLASATKVTGEGGHWHDFQFRMP